MTKGSWVHAGKFVAHDALKSPSKPNVKIPSIEINSSSTIVPLSEASSNGATKSNTLQQLGD
jgi:hypothetical protein